MKDVKTNLYWLILGVLNLKFTFSYIDGSKKIQDFVQCFRPINIDYLRVLINSVVVSASISYMLICVNGWTDTSCYSAD